MNETIIFERKAVLRLAERTEDILEHVPSLKHLYDLSLHEDGKILNTLGQPFEYTSNRDIPSDKNVNKSLVPSCLVLNSNINGVYLSSNANNKALRGFDQWIFAKGMNPSVDSDWRLKQAQTLNAKPIQEPINTKDIITAIKENESLLEIKVTDSRILIINNHQEYK